MKELLYQYAAVGGMHEAVQTFVDTKHMDLVFDIQHKIVRTFEDDMVRYAENIGKSHIIGCFQSIPEQLKKKNKKFQYSVIKKWVTASTYADSIQWMEDAGIVTRSYNIKMPDLPLDSRAKRNIFKVYMCDCGLFTSMLEDDAQYNLLQGNLCIDNGAVIESLAADIFYKIGR